MIYPDGAHNAEGLAVDPLGNLYVLTKGVSSATFWESPSRIYRLTHDQIWGATDEPHQLEFVSEIDLPALAEQHGDDMAAIATAFDILLDGERYLILTRRQAYGIFTRPRQTPPTSYPIPFWSRGSRLLA